MKASELRLIERAGDEFRQLSAKPGSLLGAAVRKDIQVERVRAVTGRDRVLEFVISTSSRDRYGDIVQASGCEAENYLKNPVVLWAHNNHELPVAKALEVKIQAKRVLTVEEFTPPDLNPFGYMVYRMYAGGFLSACSIGFRILEAEPLDDDDPSYFYPLDIKRWELLENSKVPVPANPECLVKAHEAGIDTAPLRQWCERILDLEGKIRGLSIGEVERAWKAVSTPGFVIELSAGAGDDDLEIETPEATDPTTPGPSPGPTPEPGPVADPAPADPAPEPEPAPAPEPVAAEPKRAFTVIEAAADGSRAWITAAKGFAIGERIVIAPYGVAEVKLGVPGSLTYLIERAPDIQCAECGLGIEFAQAKIGLGARSWHEACALGLLEQRKEPDVVDTELEIEVETDTPTPEPKAEDTLDLDGVESLDELRSLIAEAAGSAARSTILGGS